MDNLRNDIEYYLERGRVLSARVGSLVKIVALMDDRSILIETIDTADKTTAARFFRWEYIEAVITEMDSFAPLAFWLVV